MQVCMTYILLHHARAEKDKLRSSFGKKFSNENIVVNVQEFLSKPIILLIDDGLWKLQN